MQTEWVMDIVAMKRSDWIVAPVISILLVNEA